MNQSAAEAWFTDVADRHGQRLDEDRVLIPHSQRSLARQYKLSPGTVHQYRQALGDALRPHEGGGLVFHLPSSRATTTDSSQSSLPSIGPPDPSLDQLVQLWGRLDSFGFTVLARPDGRPPTINDLAVSQGLHRNTFHRLVDKWLESGELQQRGRYLSVVRAEISPEEGWPPDDLAPHDHILTVLTNLSAAAVQLAETATTELLPRVATLIETIADLTRIHLEEPRFSGQPRGAKSAKPRDRAVQKVQNRAVPENHKENTSFLVKVSKNSYLLDKDPARAEATQCNPARAAQPVPSGPSADSEIDEACASLADFCRDNNIRHWFDERGHQLLRPYSPVAVRYAAEKIRKDAVASRNTTKPIRSPLSVLVSKAEHEPEFFALPIPNPPSTWEPPLIEDRGIELENDLEELAKELRSMTSDEIAALDSELHLRPGRPYTEQALTAFRMQQLRARHAQERQAS